MLEGDTSILNLHTYIRTAMANNGKILPNMSEYNLEHLEALKLRWRAFTLLSLACLIAGFYMMGTIWSPIAGLRWFGAALPMLGYVSFTLWRNLADNHRPNEDALLTGLGLGNHLTLTRGLLLAGLLGFAVSPKPEGWLAWLPGILYALANVTDFLDGTCARRANHATVLGEKLDMSMDGIGVFLAALLAVRYGQVPAWYLLVGSARFLFLAGEWVRQKAGQATLPLGESVRRRAMAGVQMGFLAVMLLPVFSPPGTHIAAMMFGLPFLAGFLWDWLIVSQLIPSQLSFRAAKVKRLAEWYLIGMRVLLVGIAAYLLVEIGASDYRLNGTLLVAEVSVMTMVILGFVPRVSAILGLCLIGIHQMYAPLTPWYIGLILIYTTILFGGSGRLSLWQPEKRWISHKAGERHANI